MYKPPAWNDRCGLEENKIKKKGRGAEKEERRCSLFTSCMSLTNRSELLLIPFLFPAAVPPSPQADTSASDDWKPATASSQWSVQIFIKYFWTPEGNLN